MRPIRLALAAWLAIAVALPAAAADFDPSGRWEISTGESRYEVRRCGEAGDAFCARLVWLRDDARTAENLAMLNQLVMRAERAAENRWTGTATYEGKAYEATVTQLGADAISVHSCSGVFCQSFRLHRL